LDANNSTLKVIALKGNERTMKMHEEWVEENERNGGGYPIEVADEDDITCKCGKIVDIDDSIVCEICEERFCQDCIVTKPSSDHDICYSCMDKMLLER